jgi:hypothetical protein
LRQRKHENKEKETAKKQLYGKQIQVYQKTNSYRHAAITKLRDMINIHCLCAAKRAYISHKTASDNTSEMIYGFAKTKERFSSKIVKRRLCKLYISI